jgi:hypothetical protein
MSFTIPTVSGWSNFWGNTPNAYQPRFARSSTERMLSLQLATKGNRTIRAVMRALNGAAPGANATAQYARVQAGAPLTQQNGGLRVVETRVDYNANTTAADQAVINARIYDQLFNAAPATYPVNLGGDVDRRRAPL